MTNFWDERFAAEEYVYGTEPNEFVKQELQTLKPGKILFPGEGEGRNAVYAAQLGWDVTAFDSSSEGKAKAERLAKSKNVAIDYQLAAYHEANFAAESFDALVLIYTHVPAAMRREYHQKFLSFLKPGGYLLAEAFSKEQINNNTGGPRDINMLWSEEELEGDFATLSNLKVELLETELQEGEFHMGKAAVIRAVGKK
ncbi:class I SAM-dependent methyltransferase [Mangrovibacterium lignilyticum]|uniref:class I SAM-dependent methyltransferase n=1 Tax=Mangrovibacterium lignilyticum TaxID=2668052 RepID=UPI0013D11461|nr:class I SAM-dependent methyltransferase [Mangrovibacterium lignilyticum]